MASVDAVCACRSLADADTSFAQGDGGGHKQAALKDVPHSLGTAEPSNLLVVILQLELHR